MLLKLPFFSKMQLFYFLHGVSEMMNYCVSVKFTSYILELKFKVEGIQCFDFILG